MYDLNEHSSEGITLGLKGQSDSFKGAFLFLGSERAKKGRGHGSLSWRQQTVNSVSAWLSHRASKYCGWVWLWGCLQRRFSLMDWGMKVSPSVSLHHHCGESKTRGHWERHTGNATFCFLGSHVLRLRLEGHHQFLCVQILGFLIPLNWKAISVQ